MESFPKRSTLADVAKAAGVSVATASRALSGRGSSAPLTVERVGAAAERLGYVVDANAAGLVTGRTRAIGVLIPGVGRWFFGEVLSGVRETLASRGYNLVLIDAREHAARGGTGQGLAPRGRYDGIISVGIDPGDEAGMALLERARVSLVSVGATDLGASSVSIDDQRAARVATEHLIRLGHRDIACIGGDPVGDQRSSGDALRVAGYREAMAQAGLEAHSRHVPCEPRMPGGHRVAAQLLGDRRDRPTAFVGVCDEVAIGAIVAARQLGYSVPSELSVVGIDDHEHAEMFALTSVRQRPSWQGAQAAALLLDQIEGGRAEPTRIADPAALIVRASTAILAQAP